MGTYPFELYMVVFASGMHWSRYHSISSQLWANERVKKWSNSYFSSLIVAQQHQQVGNSTELFVMLYKEKKSFQNTLLKTLQSNVDHGTSLPAFSRVVSSSEPVWAPASAASPVESPSTVSSSPATWLPAVPAPAAVATAPAPSVMCQYIHIISRHRETTYSQSCRAVF